MPPGLTPMMRPVTTAWSPGSLLGEAQGAHLLGGGLHTGDLAALVEGDDVVRLVPRPHLASEHLGAGGGRGRRRGGGAADEEENDRNGCQSLHGAPPGAGRRSDDCGCQNIQTRCQDDFPHISRDLRAPTGNAVTDFCEPTLTRRNATIN